MLEQPGLKLADSRTRLAFLVLVLVQTAHSIEEYVFEFYDVFPPARFVSSLVSDNLPLGFAILNTGIVALGAWCYVARVRPSHVSARQWVWGWVIVEGANGIAHSVIALARGEYFPGLLTAPLLFATSLYLGIRLVRADRERLAGV